MYILSNDCYRQLIDKHPTCLCGSSFLDDGCFRLASAMVHKMCHKAKSLGLKVSGMKYSEILDWLDARGDRTVLLDEASFRNCCVPASHAYSPNNIPSFHGIVDWEFYPENKNAKNRLVMEIHNEWFLENYAKFGKNEATIVPHSGPVICQRCNMKNDYGAPNRPDGSYVCWECR